MNVERVLYLMLMKKAQAGFTIVELLIVIVVIAILAAISIVAYNGIQNRSYASTIQSDLAGFAKKLELIKIDSSDGLYPTSPTQAMGFNFSKLAYKVDRNNVYYAASPDRTQYALGVISRAGDSIGFVLINGSIQTNSGVGFDSTRALVGSSTASTGHAWNGSTGTWASWTN